MGRFFKAGIKEFFTIFGNYFTWINRKTYKDPHNVRYKKMQNFLRKISKSLKIEIILEGEEKLIDENVLFTANHLAAFDPLALICALDKPVTFVAKNDLIKTPFVGKCISSIDGLFIDRNDVNQSLNIMKQVERDFLEKDNKSWLIFAEGRSNLDPNRNMYPFHQSIFKPAINAKKPIQPIAFYGSFRGLRKKPTYNRYPVHIKILDPIYPSEYENMSLNELSDLVYQRISIAVDYDLRIKDHKLMSKSKSKHYSPYELML